MSKLPVPEYMGVVDYGSSAAPSEYHCGQCGAVGVKLWREYNAFLGHQSLLCGGCSCLEQSIDDKHFTVTEDDAGRTIVHMTLSPDPYRLSGNRGDQIGWRIPAVPTEDGATFWDYTSVPDSGVSWWRRLPLECAA